MNQTPGPMSAVRQVARLREITPQRETWWKCWAASHRHSTRKECAACIAARLAAEEAKLERMGRVRRWNNESYAALLARVEAGEKIATIARELDLSRGRVHQIIKKAQRIAAYWAAG